MQSATDVPYAVLSAHLVPRLRLRDVQALRGTCRTLRRAVDSVQEAVWTSIASHSFPEDHPLRLLTPVANSFEHADRLALLHSSIRSGSGKQAVFTIPIRDNHGWDGSRATPNLQGTLVVSEADFRVWLHKVVLCPEPALQEVASLPSPEPFSPNKELHGVTAVWAPDGGAVLLQYNIRDAGDDPVDDSGELGVLYLLDVSSLELRHISTTYDVLEMTAVRFSLSGQVILIFWADYTGGPRDPRGPPCRCDTHARASGDRIATFHPTGVRAQSLPSMAFTKDDRLAFAFPSKFEVYQLPLGQSEGVTPSAHVPAVVGEGAAGVITVNATGTKLAFLPACCCDIFLYDAHTLRALSTVHLDGYMLPSERKACGLVWGVYGWILSDCLCLNAANQRVQSLQVFRPQTGTASYERVVMIEGQSDQDPACSPDGRFMFVPDKSHSDGISLSVHDLCAAGKVVLTQTVCMPEAVRQAYSLRKGSQTPYGRIRLDFWWSSCGVRLLMTDHVEGCGTDILDYLMVMQF